MPFYEYQCKNCGHELEAMQKVSDAPLRKCPHCGKSQLERLMSAPVFRLKGAGWYETDFKDDKDKKRNLAEREVAPKEAEMKPDTKVAESKSEDKGAAKTETAAPKSGEPSGRKDKKPVPKSKRAGLARRRTKPGSRARRKY